MILLSNKNLKQYFLIFILINIIGILNGYIYWLYSSENEVRVNITFLNDGKSDFGGQFVDLALIKLLEKEFPEFASKYLTSEQLTSEQRAVYEVLKEKEWWEKNSRPTYLYKTAELKAFLQNNPTNSPVKNKINGYELYAKNKLENELNKFADEIMKFLINGFQYIHIKNLIQDTNEQVNSKIRKIQLDITKEKIELEYKKINAKNLNELSKNYPPSFNTTLYLTDPKESSVKYLSLDAQKLGLDINIKESERTLLRYYNELENLKSVNEFLEDAIINLDKINDGPQLNNKLVQILDKYKNKKFDKNVLLLELENNLYEINFFTTNKIKITKKFIDQKSTLWNLVFKSIIYTYLLILIIFLIIKIKA